MVDNEDMAGVRQFDEEAVLSAVMRVFWEKGYGPTTMADLAQKTGVQRGSLYNAYGDKQALLLRALDRYSQEQGGSVRTALARPDLRGAIEGFFASHLARMSAPANPHGCLMCQTALECGGRDPCISAKVREHFLRTEAALQNALQEAQNRLVLSANADTLALARFFLGVSRGMAVLHRAYGDLEAAHDVARTAVAVLDNQTSR